MLGSMSNDAQPMTFFEWVDSESQAAVCKALNAGLEGEPFYPVRIHRAFKTTYNIDEELIARCEEVLGSRFDRRRTLDDWFQRRAARAADSAA